MEFKGTKGNWNYDITADNSFSIYLENSIKTIATVLYKDVSYMPSREEAEANAKLIAEAGTVANKTGKTPRQLADENKDLLESLIELSKLVKNAGHDLWLEHSGSTDAINKATKQL